MRVTSIPTAKRTSLPQFYPIMEQITTKLRMRSEDAYQCKAKENFQI